MGTCCAQVGTEVGDLLVPLLQLCEGGTLGGGSGSGAVAEARERILALLELLLQRGGGDAVSIWAAMIDQLIAHAQLAGHAPNGSDGCVQSAAKIGKLSVPLGKALRVYSKITEKCYPTPRDYHARI